MCFLITWYGSGFYHEDKKCKAILVSFLVALLFQFLIFDPIRFVVLAVDAACWPKLQRPFVPDETARKHNRMDYLNLRLRSLRSQLMITEGHRNEELNLKYRTIVSELGVYGKVFLIHLVLIVALDESRYHHWDTITNLITYSHKDSIGVSHLMFLHQLYPFIHHTLINGFLSNDHHLTDTKYTEKEYSDGWSLPYVREPYTDKYWSIFLPWLPMRQRYSFFEKLVIDIRRHGFFSSYPELKGYIVTLRHTRKDSMKVLTYLYENNWLDNLTAAVFFDFTLYNTDADYFSVCSILMENLPYGIIRSSVDVNTVSMTKTPETLGTAVIVPLWFEPKRLRTFWVKVDLLILMLSIAVISMMSMKANIVGNLMKILEVASTHDFIDFRVPARLNDWKNIFMGFLVCLITLRLWKVMQFASIFQIFTMTLSLASNALLSTGFVICIFMMGFGIATVCINGNNNENFRSLINALASIMCFSFGFTSHVDPSDLFSGGEIVGILIYAIMSFTVAILLTNVFVSILSNFFTAAKAVRDRNRKDQITFWEFLRVEYADTIRVVRSTFGCEPSYRRKNRTVAENIKNELDLREAAAASARFKRGRHHVVKSKLVTMLEAEERERKAQAQHRKRISRTYTIAAILQT
ncbi:polycystic kidney disease 2-like 1 protein [Drosophila subobscura]|uniref:polycystic kidney disease 2-like 1 protein n=1 Tax=Drosophila subobscura TaxID=7241 RepID=UPI00155AEC3F|nr:polycystic kidney disease 2-like 1 protein [Drosophila subobscura]